ncbi:MAG: GNAT family N-acetyltransferase [Thermoplasmata archaeon]
MNEIEKARRFLSRDPIRYSYIIAHLREHSDFMLEGAPDAVLVRGENVISVTGEISRVRRLLKKLEPGGYRFHALDPVAFRAVSELLEDVDSGPTWMLEYPLETTFPHDSMVEPLVPEDAPEICKYWHGGDREAVPYILERIEKGPAYGIRMQNELVAWSLTHYITEHVMCLGFLHVKEQFRCKGLAMAISKQLINHALEKDMVPVVDIYKDNLPSLKLARKFGFREIGENHWLTCRVP